VVVVCLGLAAAQRRTKRCLLGTVSCLVLLLLGRSEDRARRGKLVSVMLLLLLLLLLFLLLFLLSLLLLLDLLSTVIEILNFAQRLQHKVTDQQNCQKQIE
jgi:hypothetical protein